MVDGGRVTLVHGAGNCDVAVDISLAVLIGDVGCGCDKFRVGAVGAIDFDFVVELDDRAEGGVYLRWDIDFFGCVGLICIRGIGVICIVWSRCIGIGVIGVICIGVIDVFWSRSVDIFLIGSVVISLVTRFFFRTSCHAESDQKAEEK